MDAACLPELLRVTTAVLELAERAQAGDRAAAEELRALARLLAGTRERGAAPGG